MPPTTAQQELSYYRSIGIDAPDLAGVIAEVQEGLPFSVLERFQAALELPSLRAAAEVLTIPESTLYHRKEKGRLTAAQSDRLARLVRLLGLAGDLFDGDRRAATRWLRTPKAALDGATPLEYAKTTVGTRAVEDLIGRAEHTVYG